MGKVYRAGDVTLGREVAIKIIGTDPGHDPERRIRIDREARLLALINHPNIASIYSVETIDGSPALVLELVDGDLRLPSVCCQVPCQSTKRLRLHANWWMHSTRRTRKPSCIVT